MNLGTTFVSMADRYEPSQFEAAWRARWKEADLFRTREEEGRPKFYGLDFFPYPSGAGLSVGHCRNYIPTDVLCRMKYMQGYNVLHPMGFDAFGLPAENEAIKRQRHPGAMVEEYGATYRRQMELIGNSYDWSRSFYSSDPRYYRWTQWIFIKLYEKGLAFRSLAAVNWCPKDLTALANEEVVGGLCERCGTPVEKRAIPQWFFKITEYAQRLIDDLDELDWPDGIKNQQRNWIGRSEGVEFEMKLSGPGIGNDRAVDLDSDRPASKPLSFRVFTTRIDTIFGMSFCVLAPELPLVDRLIEMAGAEHATAMRTYQREAVAMSETSRQAEGREKTGVFTGYYATNPATGQKVPVYIADYVLMGYGTGAIMAVPAGDQRDFEFAKQFGIPVVAIQDPSDEWLAEQGITREAYHADPKCARNAFISKDAPLINAGEYSGMPSAEAATKLGEWIEASELGQRKIQYRLRDWLISRQRYWGCPIPVVYDGDGTMEIVSDDSLPVTLPEVANYEPSDDGSSPLSRIDEFVNVTTADGTLGRRETDTMGGFACSSWYFLRFIDPHNDEEAWDPAKAAYWMPVDAYVGGAEHAVMHLLYARFWTKVLYDLGLVQVKEPFRRLQNQGQVLAMTPYRKPRPGETLQIGEDGVLVSFEEAKAMPEDELMWRWARMSKSKGNVVTPDEAVEQFGADALRMYELFVAPFDADVQWSNEAMQGAVRFLSRVFKWTSEDAALYDPTWKDRIDTIELDDTARAFRRETHQLIDKATRDIDRFAFNTYVSSMMSAMNAYNDLRKSAPEPNEGVRLALSEAMESLILVLSPCSPHTADEIWSTAMGKSGFTYCADWPVARPELAAADSITVAVQVNGKLRDSFDVPASATPAEIEAAALIRERVRAHTDGKTVRKVIVVPGKLVNIVVG